jgi:prepilin-type N-terminal cleavage/methylation domain-containing protein
MRRQKGSTLFELLTAIAVVGILAAIAVPGAAHVNAAISGAEGARRLALVLRAAQAEAQSSAASVRVEVGPGGDYAVTSAAGDRVMNGGLGAPVTSTYPGGVLEFTAKGWARLPGALSPRAGHFSIAGASETVVVQLSGCVRCT